MYIGVDFLWWLLEGRGRDRRVERSLIPTAGPKGNSKTYFPHTYITHFHIFAQ
jgi:hypothetical protein